MESRKKERVTCSAASSSHRIQNEGNTVDNSIHAHFKAKNWAIIADLHCMLQFGRHKFTKDTSTCKYLMVKTNFFTRK